MSKHTSGPWKVKKCCCGSEYCHDYWVEPPGRFVRGSGFSEADAVLIAAAPRMLRVLEDMLGDAPADGEEYPVMGNSRVVGEVVAAARGEGAGG